MKSRKKIFIKSLKRYLKDTKSIAVELLEVSTGNIINSFSSISESSKFIEMSYSTTFNRVHSGKPYEFKACGGRAAWAGEAG